jgi:hypothetical protein
MPGMGGGHGPAIVLLLSVMVLNARCEEITLVILIS